MESNHQFTNLPIAGVKGWRAVWDEFRPWLSLGPHAAKWTQANFGGDGSAIVIRGSLRRSPGSRMVDAVGYLKNTPLRSWPITAPTRRPGFAGSDVN